MALANYIFTAYNTLPKLRQPALLALLFFIQVIPASALDILTASAKKYEGTFEGCDGNQFLFRTDGGELLKQRRTSVRTLTLGEPLDAELVQEGKKQPESIKLLGYDDAKFNIEQNGKRRDLFGMKVHSIMVHRPVNEEGAVGSRLIVNLTELESRVDLTPAQTKALTRYKTIRLTHDKFVAENLEFVKKMDITKGAQRESLMNTLRLRKNQEQPLLLELKSAEAEFLTAFPASELKPASSVSADSAAAGPASGSKLPEVGEGEVVLIDVSEFEKTKDLSKTQTSALKRYKAAKDAYTLIVNGDEAEQKKAEAELKKAQAHLLQAFPNIKFSTP